ncbi:MAG: hypothetical protein WCG55_02955 [bacterium]
MEVRKHTFVALYDASPEHAHFESSTPSIGARTLGRALGEAHLGVISHVGPTMVNTVFAELSCLSVVSIALSPASNMDEHTRAFRLPVPHVPLVFTGRGALGADTIALASSHAVVLFGSQVGKVEAILDHMLHVHIPIGILTDETPSTIHERVRAHHPNLTSMLFVSHDPKVLVREIADELRRREFTKKLA